MVESSYIFNLLAYICVSNPQSVEQEQKVTLCTKLHLKWSYSGYISYLLMAQEHIGPGPHGRRRTIPQSFFYRPMAHMHCRTGSLLILDNNILFVLTKRVWETNPDLPWIGENNIYHLKIIWYIKLYCKLYLMHISEILSRSRCSHPTKCHWSYRMRFCHYLDPGEDKFHSVCTVKLIVFTFMALSRIMICL